MPFLRILAFLKNSAHNTYKTLMKRPFLLHGEPYRELHLHGLLHGSEVPDAAPDKPEEDIPVHSCCTSWLPFLLEAEHLLDHIGV